MKYGLSRSLNWSSLTDLSSSLTMARMTGSEETAAVWLWTAAAAARSSKVQMTLFPTIRRVTSGLLWLPRVAEEWVDDPKTLTFSGLRSALRAVGRRRRYWWPAR